jgi:site-specific DNA-methyltransferase (adenine-specific)
MLELLLLIGVGIFLVFAMFTWRHHVKRERGWEQMGFPEFERKEGQEMSSKDSTAGATPLTPSWHLYLGDCDRRDAGTARSKSVDVFVCDPPYSEHVHANGRRGASLTSGHGRVPTGTVSQKRELGFDHMTEAQRVSVAREMVRLARRWALIFCDVESAHLWREEFAGTRLEYIRTAFWRRLGAAPQFSGDRPAAACEAVVVCHGAERLRWNGGGKAGFYEEGIAGKSAERFHPAEKPLALMERLVADFTEPGELVCDPFAGSATTGVACLRLGRRFVGWEREPSYHAAGLARLRAAEAQGSLFVAKAQAAGPRIHLG